MFEVTDDSGFLALVVPGAYESFVANDWSLDQILAHFRVQMARRALLIWGTGREGTWNVEAALNKSKAKGIREVNCSIHVVGGAVLLANYESLTMAAQFKNITLPEKHQEHLLMSLPDGDYACRIIQMFDPERAESAGNNRSDFVVELQRVTNRIGAWESIPWFKVDR